MWWPEQCLVNTGEIRSQIFWIFDSPSSKTLSKRFGLPMLRKQISLSFIETFNMLTWKRKLPGAVLSSNLMLSASKMLHVKNGSQHTRNEAGGDDDDEDEEDLHLFGSGGE